MTSLEDLIRSSSRALVVGVGGGGDVVGALATARFLQFCGVGFVLGGLSWERPEIDPLPGPRSVQDVMNVHPLHQYAWLAKADSRTVGGAVFAESRMAGILGEDVLLLDINGGVVGVVDALQAALIECKADFLVGVDVGGDSLAKGIEPGLYSPLADAIMLSAYAELEAVGWRTLWAVFGYGSDGEMTNAEIECALREVAQKEGLLGAWGLTKRVVAELTAIVQTVPTEASAIPLRCAQGAWGETKIRRDQRGVKLTPLTTLTFFLSPTIVMNTLSIPAQAVRRSASLDEANEALHSLGIETELDRERREHATHVDRKW